jgi:hypothetical protein
MVQPLMRLTSGCWMTYSIGHDIPMNSSWLQQEGANPDASITLFRTHYGIFEEESCRIGILQYLKKEFHDL